MIGEVVTCPNCGGKGTVEITRARLHLFMEHIGRSGQLAAMPNGKLADALREVESYLRNRDLSHVIFEMFDEVWWRLHAANEPIEATRRKIESLQDDDEWLSQ